jgi:hypothetical protein
MDWALTAAASRRLAAVIVLAALCGCSKPAGQRTMVMEDSAPQVDLQKLAPPNGGGKPPIAHVAPTPASTIAYAYSYSIQAPSGGLHALMKRHQAACTAVGPAVCQLLDSNFSTSDAFINATLNLRAEPGWLARFRDQLDGDAKAAGGRITSSETKAEDLGRTLVDTQATLRAETALRDRLQALLETHPGKLSDLLEVEKELATAQGELDGTQSELAELQGRVQLSKLTITYSTPVAFQPASAALNQAFGNFTNTLSISAAAIVTLIAALLPWAVLVGIVGAGWWAALRKWGKPPAKP